MWKRSESNPIPGVHPSSKEDAPRPEAAASRTASGTNAEARSAAPRLGRSVTITGELSSSEELVIEGRVNGSIECKQHKVVIGHDAAIKATIYAKDVAVFGKVVGNVTATDKIDVREDGTIEGDLASPIVSIAEGAVFRGSIDMTRQSAESAA